MNIYVCYVFLFIQLPSAGIATVTTTIYIQIYDIVQMLKEKYSTTKRIYLPGPMMGQHMHDIDMLQNLQLFINLLMKLLTAASNKTSLKLTRCVNTSEQIDKII